MLFSIALVLVQPSVGLVSPCFAFLGTGPGFFLFSTFDIHFLGLPCAHPLKTCLGGCFGKACHKEFGCLGPQLVLLTPVLVVCFIAYCRSGCVITQQQPLATGSPANPGFGAPQIRLRPPRPRGSEATSPCLTAAGSYPAFRCILFLERLFLGHLFEATAYFAEEGRLDASFCPQGDLLAIESSVMFR